MRGTTDDQTVHDVLADSILDPAGRDLGSINEEIVPGGTLSASDAVGVYRNGYYARLSDQLGETYESVWWVLGDHGFFEICEQFIRGHRSDSYNLSDYGTEFSDYLATLPISTEFPFLVELSDFERRYMGVFHAKEHEHLTSAALAGVEDPATLGFELGSASELLRYSHGVYEVWRKRKSGQASQADIAWSRNQDLLLYKYDGMMGVLVLEVAEYATLSALARGLPLGQALETAAATHSDFDGPAVQTFFEKLWGTGVLAGTRAQPA